MGRGSHRRAVALAQRAHRRAQRAADSPRGEHVDAVRHVGREEAAGGAVDVHEVDEAGELLHILVQAQGTTRLRLARDTQVKRNRSLRHMVMV